MNKSPESLWINASAGSGKTTLLVKRVVDLIKSGVPAERICVLTFTNVAAQEVQARVLAALASCQENSPTMLVADLPVMTLHSFCYNLLQRFSVEAGLGTEMFLAEEEQQARLWMKSIKRSVREAPPWVRRELFLQVGEASLPGLGESLKNAVALYDIDLQAPSQVEGLAPSRFEFNKSLWQELSAQSSLKTVHGQNIMRMAQRLVEREVSFSQEDLFSLFFTSSGQRRARLFPKELSLFGERILEEGERIYAYIGERQKSKDARLSQAVYIWISRCLQYYQIFKAQERCVDYHDIISEAVKLLQKEECDVFEFLETTCHHLLIDEAQDTSITQWRIIVELVKSMAVHWEGKTLFVVGDTKQSIYGFQGVCLATMDLVKQNIESCIGKMTLQSVDHCYRCAPQILELVNTINAEYGYGWSVQKSVRNAQGLVARLPLISVKEEEFALAEKVAQLVASMIQEGFWLESCDRAVQAQDILILTQQRDLTYRLVPEYLSRYGVPCLGVDSVGAKSSVCVELFVLCAEAILFPEDSMTLASLLRSPLFMWSHERIEEVVGKGSNLWETIKSENCEFSKHVVVFIEYGKKWSQQGLSLFFKWLFSCKKERWTKYFGAHVVSGFLELCQEYEIKKDHSVVGFIDWLLTENPSMRMTSFDSGGVRMMTVHGAKGLEAPVVIILDAHRVPSETKVRWRVQEDLSLHVSSKNDFWEVEKFVLQDKKEEYERLLYVALTRAKDALFVAGSAENLKPGCWYELVQDFVKEYSVKDLEKQSNSWEEVVAQEELLAPEVSVSQYKFFRQNDKAVQEGVYIHKGLLVVLKSGKNAEALSSYQESVPLRAQKAVKEATDTFFNHKWSDLLMSGAPFFLEREFLSERSLRLLRPDYVGIFSSEVWVVDFKAMTIKTCVPENYIKQVERYCAYIKKQYPDKKIKGGILPLPSLKMHWVVAI